MNVAASTAFNPKWLAAAVTKIKVKGEVRLYRLTLPYQLAIERSVESKE